jgi:hypothetical protein
MKIILLPLEPLEERYTTQWYVWFSNYVHKYEKSIEKMVNIMLGKQK